MTIGIAVTFNDGVLLVADGRRTYPLNPILPPQDDVNKIFQISPTIGAITFGVSQATDFVLHNLSLSLPPRYSPKDVSTIVKSSVNVGWSCLMSIVAPDVDVHHERVKVGLVVGGLTNNQPFVTGALKYSDGENCVLEEGEYKFIVLGGEEQNAKDEFNQIAERAVQQFGANREFGLMDNLVEAFLRGAADTINLVSAKRLDVGGTIRYAVIRRGYPYTTGAL